MVSSQNCPSDEKLAAFAEGRLHHQERAPILSHLDRCDTCRDITAANLSLLEADIDRVSQVPAKATTHFLRRAGLATVPLAAMLLIALVFVYQNRKTAQSYQDALLAAQFAMDESRTSGSPMSFRFLHSLSPSPQVIVDPKRGLADKAKVQQDLAIKKLVPFQENERFGRDAGLHLVTLYLLKHQYSNAVKIAAELRTRFESDPDVLSTAALTRYLFAQSKNRVQDQQKAIGDLEQLQKRFPAHAATAYNLGMLYFENQRSAEAAKVWETYVDLEAHSSLSDHLKSLLSQSQDEGE